MSTKRKRSVLSIKDKQIIISRCLINIHIFDYPDSRLSGLFTLVPPSPDNQGSTVLVDIFTYLLLAFSLIYYWLSQAHVITNIFVLVFFVCSR